MIQLFPESVQQTEERWRLRRVAELKAFLENLDCACDDVAEKMRRFRSANCSFSGGRVVFISDDPNSRMSLEQRWKDLIEHRNQVLQERNRVLEELAGLISPPTMAIRR